MTLSEFKAWFEGFSEGIDKAPTEKQFAKIKAKVAEITGTPTTYPVFIDRYVRPYPVYWERPYASRSTSTYTSTLPNLKAMYAGTGTLSASNVAGMNATAEAALERQANSTLTDTEWANSQAEQWFDSHAAMRDLGRVEALN